MVEEHNAIKISAIINGHIIESSMKLPNVTNLTDDDNIGEVGFALGQNSDMIARELVVKYNKLVEKEQTDARK